MRGEGRSSFFRPRGGGGVFSASLRGPGALEVVAQLAREHGVVREHRVDGRAVRAERLGERRLDVGRHAECFANFGNVEGIWNI